MKIKASEIETGYHKNINEIMTLHRIKIAKLLGESLVGSISTWCNYETGELFVEIINDFSKLPYRFTVYQLVDRVLDGQTSEDIADFIIKRYKSTILRKYFK